MEVYMSTAMYMEILPYIILLKSGISTSTRYRAIESLLICSL
jgi:hypothetical protein